MMNHFFYVCIPVFLIITAQPSTKCIGNQLEKKQTIQFKNELLLLSLNQYSIGHTIQTIEKECGVSITGLEYRQSEIITFFYHHASVEETIKKFLRHIHEQNFTLEYRGDQLVHVSILPQERNEIRMSTSKQNDEISNIFKDPHLTNSTALSAEAQKKAQYLNQLKNPHSNSDWNETTAKKLKAINKKYHRGVRIFEIINGSQAQEIEIKKGDAILEYNGIRITSGQQLVKEVKKTTEEDQVNMLIFSDGDIYDVSLRGGFIGVRITNVNLTGEKLDEYYPEVVK